MKRLTTIFAIFLIQTAITNTLSAQSDTTGGSYHESVIVVGDYKPVLDGVTDKVNVPPVVNDNVSSALQPKFTYGITPRRMSSLTTTTGLKAAKVVASPIKLYDNYLKFGLGHDFANFADFNPLVDLYYTSKRHDDYAYGGRVYHQTDWTTFGKEDKDNPSPDYYGRNRQSVTQLDAFGKYILNKKHLFSANLAMDREYGRYYGFSDSTLFATSGLVHSDLEYSDYDFAYNNVGLSLGARSLNIDVNQFGYEAQMDLGGMWAMRDFNQLSMCINGDVHYGFPLLSKYKAVTYMKIRWESYRQRRDQEALAWAPTISTDVRQLIYVGPYADFLFRDFKVHAGFGVDVNAYDDPGSAKVILSPDIVISKSFNNNQMSLTAGLTGGFTANDWNKIRLLNPYVVPAPYTKATFEDDLFAHLRINFSKRLILNINADNYFYKNKVFFMTDLTSQQYGGWGNMMSPYYLDVNCLVLGSDFTFVNDEMISLTIGGEYYLYYNKEEEVPLYHTPAFIGHLDADVNYKDKWLVRAAMLLITKQDAYYDINNPNTYLSVTGEIKARFGISLEGEYLYSRALSFFAKVDNVTFQKYFLWANYPAQRFNLMLGLTYTIPTK